ncbi:hypothetical protein V6N11_035528 [Hibiscus sabdariffa]|uniref:Uncharacterized protein n=2 Tax=Hibiscus sabdariffa TaxID=183260 RepID=A0ABR2BQY2_9ROSI
MGLRVEGLSGGQCQGVEVVLDEEKMLVLETYALGWVKEVDSIRNLANEMVVAGFDGFKIMWVVGSMVLLAFLDASSRQRVMSKEVLSTCFGRLEEWSASAGYESWRAWLSISGLLIHLWSDGSFRNIVGLWGMYIRVDAAMEEQTLFQGA